jgi:hypothetical protein
LSTYKNFWDNLVKRVDLDHKDCSICKSKHDDLDHDPHRVLVVDCYHIFEYTCLNSHTAKHNACPVCKTIWFEPVDLSLKSSREEDKVENSTQFAERLHTDYGSVRYWFYEEPAFKTKAAPSNVAWIAYHGCTVINLQKIICEDKGIDGNGCDRLLEAERMEIQKLIQKARSDGHAAQGFSLLCIASWKEPFQIAQLLFDALISSQGERLQEMFKEEVQIGRSKKDILGTTEERWKNFSAGSPYDAVFVQLFLLIVWIMHVEGKDDCYVYMSGRWTPRDTAHVEVWLSSVDGFQQIGFKDMD